MDFNTEGNRKSLINFFPHLFDDKHYKLLSEQTPIYNCIAWAMGFNDRWVDTVLSPGHWWPDGVLREDSPQALIDAFVAVGFEVVDNDHYEENYDKVALFQKEGKWTHAARIESDEVEYSKFGGSFDGVHSHNVFGGSIYGDEYAFLRRHISQRGTEGNVTKGSVKINLANLLF